jgi:hypothetical protein
VDKKALDTCIEQTDNKFGISKDYANKNKWKGHFPPFGVHADLNKKYGVRGSPALVINDVVVRSGRSPQAILDAVCHGFTEKPKECGKKLSEDWPWPGFFGVGKGKWPDYGQQRCQGWPSGAGRSPN